MKSSLSDEHDVRPWVFSKGPGYVKALRMQPIAWKAMLKGLTVTVENVESMSNIKGPRTLSRGIQEVIEMFTQGVL